MSGHAGMRWMRLRSTSNSGLFRCASKALVRRLFVAVAVTLDDGLGFVVFDSVALFPSAGFSVYLIYFITASKRFFSYFSWRT